MILIINIDTVELVLRMAWSPQYRKKSEEKYNGARVQKDRHVMSRYDDVSIREHMHEIIQRDQQAHGD